MNLFAKQIKIIGKNLIFRHKNQIITMIHLYCAENA